MIIMQITKSSPIVYFDWNSIANNMCSLRKKIFTLFSGYIHYFTLQTTLHWTLYSHANWKEVITSTTSRLILLFRFKIVMTNMIVQLRLGETIAKSSNRLRAGALSHHNGAIDQIEWRPKRLLTCSSNIFDHKLAQNWLKNTVNSSVNTPLIYLIRWIQYCCNSCFECSSHNHFHPSDSWRIFKWIDRRIQIHFRLLDCKECSCSWLERIFYRISKSSKWCFCFDESVTPLSHIK